MLCLYSFFKLISLEYMTANNHAIIIPHFVSKYIDIIYSL